MTEEYTYRIWPDKWSTVMPKISKIKANGYKILWNHTYSLGLMFVDFKILLVLGDVLLSLTGLFHYKVGQFITLFNALWGCKLMGKKNPQNPRTVIPQKQSRCHSNMFLLSDSKDIKSWSLSSLTVPSGWIHAAGWLLYSIVSTTVPSCPWTQRWHPAGEARLPQTPAPPGQWLQCWPAYCTRHCS